MSPKALISQNEIVLEELIGEGATGTVYRAQRRDSQSLISQTIALKIFKSPNHLSIFKNEVENLLCVKSSYCVSLFGWESFAEGPAMLMEWVEGVSLANMSFGLSEEELLEIQRQVLAGLHDLEAQGLCHGDLSLNNILIDTQGCVRLIDFGLSRWRDSYSENVVPYGTLQFLSPERWKGKPPTIADDLYALGRILQDLKQGFVGFSLGSSYWHERALMEEGQGLLHRDPNQRKVNPPIKNEKTIQGLAKKVEHIKAASSSRSVVSMTKINMRDWLSWQMFCPYLVRALCFSLLLLFSTSESSIIQRGTAALEIRSHRWIQVALDHKPLGYSPLHVQELNPGLHILTWTTATDQGQLSLELKNGQTLVLTEENFF
ncbi:MAG: serine/threonine protein kinase [Bdellovibrionales bacterium]